MNEHACKVVCLKKHRLGYFLYKKFFCREIETTQIRPAAGESNPGPLGFEEASLTT